MKIRELILKRVGELRQYYGGGFPKTQQRWERPLYNPITGYKYYANEIVWEELSDESLLAFFEALLKRHYAQM